VRTYISLIRFTPEGIAHIKETAPARVDAGRETL
jgi:hypothetical protein